MLRLTSYERYGVFELAFFQQEAVHFALVAFENNVPAALEVMPTGSGKTVVGVCVAVHLCAQYRCRTLILVHRHELMQQWGQVIKLACPGLRVSFVSNRSNDWGGEIVIASVPKLRRDLLTRVDKHRFALVLVDEAHHASASQWQRVMDYFRPKLRLGLSATPIRGDGICVAEDFGNLIIYMITWRRLIELGKLVDAKGWRVSTNIDLSGVPLNASNDYDLKELSKVINIAPRNRAAVEAYRAYGEDLPTIAFTADVDHAIDVAQAFNTYTISARAVYGRMARQERDSIIDLCRTGPLQILSNAALLCEGFDAPRLKAVLLLRSFTECSARVLLAQMIGRALRPFPTDPGRYPYAVVIELVDEDRRCDKPTVDLFSAFGIDGEDLKKVDTQGQLASQLATQIERSKQELLHEVVCRNVCKESIRHLLAPSSLNGSVEAFDVLRVLEEATGLRYLLFGDTYILPLQSDERRRSRMVRIRRDNGLYQAVIVSAEGIEHFTAGVDLQKVFADVKWKLNAMGESTIFAEANRAWRKEPMTASQRDLIAFLTRQPAEGICEMPRGEASDWITILLATSSHH